MQVASTSQFKKIVKRLNSNQKIDLDNAIKDILRNPNIGISKTGDLSHIKVYKFKMVKQLTLIAYSIDSDTIYLRTVGSHENFYDKIKRKFK